MSGSVRRSLRNVARLSSGSEDEDEELPDTSNENDNDPEVENSGEEDEEEEEEEDDEEDEDEMEEDLGDVGEVADETEENQDNDEENENPDGDNQSDAMSTTSSASVTNFSLGMSPSQSGNVLSTSTNNKEDQLSNFKTQTELRRQYSELIETCQGYRDKDGIEKDLKEMMTRNIKRGSQLFTKIGGGPGDMYMAFLHTKMCSGMILSKTEKIGASASGFQLEQFFASLMEKAHGDFGEYSPLVASKMIAQEANLSQKTLPTLVALLGSFDRNSILTPPEVKEKKQKTPRRKQFEESEEATHHEEVKLTEEQRAQKDKDSPEALSQEILRILNNCCHNQKTPAASLLEFTMHKNSLPHFFENLFYVSFLVRDGYVSIKRKKRRKGDHRSFDSDLLIAPEEPPRKTAESKEESTVRSQHILSFNARTFKALSDASHGPPLIHCPRRHKHFKIAQSPT